MSQQINLYNPALAPKVELLSGSRMLVALAAVVAVCLLAWGVAAGDAARLARQERVQAARLAQLQGEVTSMTQQVAARKPSAELQAELDHLAALLGARHEVMALLESGSLGDTRGVSEYFRAFARQTTEGLWLTGFSIGGAGNDIVIQGRTLDADLVPAYLRKLRRESALRGHGFESMSVYQPPPRAGDRPAPGYLEFRMATSAREPAADLDAASKPGGAR
jgi:Tfp pilus assembly protein PilN